MMTDVYLKYCENLKLHYFKKFSLNIEISLIGSWQFFQFACEDDVKMEKNVRGWDGDGDRAVGARWDGYE